jgi:hypothetical protein
MRKWKKLHVRPVIGLWPFTVKDISVRDVEMNRTIRMIGERLNAYKILVATFVGNDRLNTPPYTGR